MDLSEFYERDRDRRVALLMNKVFEQLGLYVPHHQIERVIRAVIDHVIIDGDSVQDVQLGQAFDPVYWDPDRSGNPKVGMTIPCTPVFTITRGTSPRVEVRIKP